MKKIFEKKDKKVALGKNITDCTLCNTCLDVCKPKAKRGEKESEPAIKVKGDDTKFIFKFETDGSMTAKEALNFTLRFLEDKFNDFRDQISKLK